VFIFSGLAGAARAPNDPTKSAADAEACYRSFSGRSIATIAIGPRCSTETTLMTLSDPEY
jgi:hypothetical protein